MDILSRIRLEAMQLAVDDFRTGYSSLKILRQLPFSEPADLAVSRGSRATVQSIADLAANMNMASVAEAEPAVDPGQTRSDQASVT